MSEDEKVIVDLVAQGLDKKNVYGLAYLAALKAAAGGHEFPNTVFTGMLHELKKAEREFNK